MMKANKLMQKWSFFYNPMVTLLACITIIGCTNDSGSDGDTDQNSSNGKGEISGTIKDEDGNPYDNVTIELKQGVKLNASKKTDEAGTYSFVNIAADKYDVRLILPLATDIVGSEIQAVTVKKGVTETIDFTLSTLSIKAMLTLGSDDILGEVRDKNGQIPSDTNEPLYAVNVFTDMSLVPILGSDDEHVILGDWNKAKGSANIYCNGNVSHFEFSFSGLLPLGVYTLWLVPYDGSDVTGVGTGALGSASGSENVMTADISGKAETSIEMKPGSLSVFGILGSCVLTNGTKMIIILDYHIDGKSHGTTAGPDHTEVAHMSFVF